MTPEERIDRALEGLLDPEEWEALQAELLADPQLLQRYTERSWLHAQLSTDRHQLPELLEVAESNQASRMPRKRIAAGMLLAASLAIAFTLGLFSGQQETPVVATLVQAENCRWAGSDLPTTQGSTLGAGTLALVEGMATLRFESGAEITLEAPSTLEVLSKMRCRLIEGSLVADVPESAHGFTIDTEEMEVIDLGTRFGLTASGLGKSHLYVFEGIVEVERENEARRRLETGQALVHGDHTNALDQEIDRSAQPLESADGWTSIPTSYGAGKDAYVRQHETELTGGHPLLMVKSTDFVEKNVRRTYLSFDLGSTDFAHTEEAELLLQVRSSGLGFSALVPDSRFAIYGLEDDSWSESGLLWENAPEIELSGLTKLATFEIRKGATPSEVRARSKALAEYIRSSDDGIASFVIVRETGELEKQGLVHAFASKEHPTAQAPTLRLKTEGI